MYKFRTKGLSSYFLYFLLTLTLTWCVCSVLDTGQNVLTSKLGVHPRFGAARTRIWAARTRFWAARTRFWAARTRIWAARIKKKKKR